MSSLQRSGYIVLFLVSKSQKLPQFKVHFLALTDFSTTSHGLHRGLASCHGVIMPLFIDTAGTVHPFNILNSV